jgi:anti-sigma B factor antagonist
MARQDELPIECITITDGLIIRPIGDIDLNQAPTLRTHIAEAFQKTPARLIIDLSQVTYMDSSGVATLVEAMQLATRGGTKLFLAAMQVRVRSIFEIARLDTVFTITADVAAAESA